MAWRVCDKLLTHGPAYRLEPRPVGSVCVGWCPGITNAGPRYS